MLDRFDTTWFSIEPPQFKTVFDHYIVAYEVENPWMQKDELGAIEIPEEKWRGLQFIIDSNRILPLESLSKSKLRQVRHQVLLKKGHKYHAAEITEYFLHRHHRRELDSNAIHTDYSEAELYLLKCLTDLIYL